MRSEVPQATEQSTSPAGGWWDAWTAIAEEPALVEFLLFAVVALVFFLLNFRMSRLVRESRERAAVKDYLLGVEQALSGDLAGAPALEAIAICAGWWLVLVWVGRLLLARGQRVLVLQGG